MLEALLSIGDLDGLDIAMADLAAAFPASPLSRLPNLRTWYSQTTTSLQMSRNLIAGRFDAVEAPVAEVEAELNETNIARGIGAEFGRTQLAYFRGDWEESSRSWERARAIVPGAIDVYFGFMTVGSPLPAVREYCERFLEIDRPEVTKASNVAVAAEGLRRIDAREASAAYASEFVAHAGFFVTNGTAYFHGSYDTALGILLTTARELDRAVRYLEQGVELCDEIRSPSFGALARLELATTLRLRNAPGDDALAAAAAGKALAAATGLGMHGWVDRIERLRSGDLEWWRLPDDRWARLRGHSPDKVTRERRQVSPVRRLGTNWLLGRTTGPSCESRAAKYFEDYEVGESFEHGSVPQDLDRTSQPRQ